MIDYFNQIFSEISQVGHLFITIKFLKQSASLSERTPNSNKNNVLFFNISKSKSSAVSLLLI